MGKIRATCPECGTIELSSNDVGVVKYVNGDLTGSFMFKCPRETSDKVFQKDAGELILNLLEAAGCYVIEIDLSDPPAEIAEQRLIVEQQGPVLIDECIDLGLLAVSQEFDGLLKTN